MPLNERRQGFILPLAVLLVVILTISGASFLHHDYLERRMAMNNVDNHGAFYLANAGLERARATFKIPPDGTWTTVLDLDPATAPEYPPDPSPVFCPLCLCGEDLSGSTGCVIPSFGAVVSTGLPFDALFDDGQYEMRAFNNEPSRIDTDQIMMFRARGTIQGERKLLEVTAKASTGLGLVNCQGAANTPCPEQIIGNATTLENLDGRDPRPIATLPAFDPAFYSDPVNFPFTTTTVSCGSGINCAGSTITINAQNNRFYLVEGLADPVNTLVELDTGGTRQNVVLFSEAKVKVEGTDHFTNSVIASLSNVQLQGDVTLEAPTTPLMYPAIVSGGNVGSDASVEVFGNIYSSGTIDVNPIKVHGLLVGSEVKLQGATEISDEDNPAYYSPMPGFTYPPELLTNETVTSSWRELQ